MTPTIENCLNCGKKPLMYGGHVHKKESILLAGWCGFKCLQNYRTEKACGGGGCYGKFKRKSK